MNTPKMYAGKGLVSKTRATRKEFMKVFLDLGAQEDKKREESLDAMAKVTLFDLANGVGMVVKGRKRQEVAFDLYILSKACFEEYKRRGGV
jgi:hypothetical protein